MTASQQQATNPLPNSTSHSDLLPNSSNHDVFNGDNLELGDVVLEEVALDMKEDEDFKTVLKVHNDADLEYLNQNKYLSSFGLQRNPIIGDGNCVFRSISFSLYGHQDNHLLLRNLAVETLGGNVDFFQNYFLEESTTPEDQINILAQPNNYAGQESILALSMALNINILVTFGGDQQNPSVTTFHNAFSQGQSQQSIHIAWRRAGGGHVML